MTTYDTLRTLSQDFVDNLTKILRKQTPINAKECEGDIGIQNFPNLSSNSE